MKEAKQLTMEEAEKAYLDALQELGIGVVGGPASVPGWFPFAASVVTRQVLDAFCKKNDLRLPGSD
jgi:hypothetical protein